MAVTVLDEMKKLDQKIAIARLIAEKSSNVFEGLIIELPAFGVRPSLAPAATGMSLLSSIALGHSHGSPHLILVSGIPDSEQVISLENAAAIGNRAIAAKPRAMSL
jgi:hypothetical protein